MLKWEIVQGPALELLAVKEMLDARFKFESGVKIHENVIVTDYYTWEDDGGGSAGSEDQQRVLEELGVKGWEPGISVI